MVCYSSFRTAFADPFSFLLSKIPKKVRSGFDIFGGLLMLASGNPAGAFFVASGATGFGKGSSWQIASGVLGFMGAAATLAGSSGSGGPGGSPGGGIFGGGSSGGGGNFFENALLGGATALAASAIRYPFQAPVYSDGVRIGGVFAPDARSFAALAAAIDRVVSKQVTAALLLQDMKRNPFAAYANPNWRVGQGQRLGYALELGTELPPISYQSVLGRPLPSSIERAFAHELGHAYAGLPFSKDENFILNRYENQIMRAFGEPDRAR